MGVGVADQGGFAAACILTLNRKERGRLPTFVHPSLDFWKGRAEMWAPGPGCSEGVWAHMGGPVEECRATPVCGWSGFSCHKSPILFSFLSYLFIFFASLVKIEAMVLG